MPMARRRRTPTKDAKRLRVAHIEYNMLRCFLSFRQGKGLYNVRIGTFDAKAVIFDFDGTLADSMWVWDYVDRRWLEKRNIPFNEEYAEMIAVLGFEGGADYVVNFFKLDENPEDIIEEWKSDAQEGYATQVKLKPGAREYLASLREAGVPMAIATSLQRALLEPCLKNNGIYEYFETICVCDELNCGGKSNPAVYLEAAKHLGVDPQECAIFEDVVIAAKSAKKTGAYVVGVYDEHKQQATDELKETVDLFIDGYEGLQGNTALGKS